MRRHYPIIPVLALAALLASGPAGAETLTNEDVVDLVKSGLGEELIVLKISTSKCRFDVCAKKLVELKKAKVPEKIIKLMLETHAKELKRIKAAVQVAIQGFKDPDPKQYQRALRELVRLGPDAIPEIVKQGLGNEDEKVRGGCSEAIGQIGHRDGLEPVFGMLPDRSELARVKAAKALKYLVEKKDRERIYKRLMGMLTDIEKPRDAAVIALGALGETRAAPQLRRMAQGDTSPRMRAAAVTALGEMRDKASLALITKRLLEDRDGRVRAAAATALAKLGDKKAVLPLIKAFERYPQDRRNFVGPMAAFRDKLIVETFIEALEDDDARVKEMAWQALKLLTDESMKKDRAVWSEWWEIDGRKRF